MRLARFLGRLVAIEQFMRSGTLIVLACLFMACAQSTPYGPSRILPERVVTVNPEVFQC
jgi:hypothetical protein